MRISLGTRVSLGVITAVILALVYVPLLVVLINSFSTSASLTWPPPPGVHARVVGAGRSAATARSRPWPPAPSSR